MRKAGKQGISNLLRPMPKTRQLGERSKVYALSERMGRSTKKPVYYRCITIKEKLLIIKSQMNEQWQVMKRQSGRLYMEKQRRLCPWH